MTTYLLDENVLRELHPKGHARVRTWYATVSTDDLRISAMTFFEKRRGAERFSRTDPNRAATILDGIQALEAAYGSRIVPIDGLVAAEWARLLGAKDTNQRDRALAATARAHGFVLVTRNVEDVRGCDVESTRAIRSGTAGATGLTIRHPRGYKNTGVRLFGSMCSRLPGRIVDRQSPLLERTAAAREGGAIQVMERAGRGLFRPDSRPLRRPPRAQPEPVGRPLGEHGAASAGHMKLPQTEARADLL